MSSLLHALHACVMLVRCVEAFIRSVEAHLLLDRMLHIGWMLRRRRMMGFSPPQTECQVVDCEAAYYNRDANDLHEMVNIPRLQRRSRRKATYYCLQ